MDVQQRYVYCGRRGCRWELVEGDEAVAAVTPSALHHLLVTGAVRRTQRVRCGEEGETRGVWEWKELLRRQAYGQLLPKMFDSKERFWFYKGHSGAVQGPFPGDKMQMWFEGGYLYEQMKVAVQTGSEMSTPDEEFKSLEDVLLFMSQPVFCSEALSREKPLRDLRLIHCPVDSLVAYVGEWEAVEKLPSNLPSASVMHAPMEPAGAELGQVEKEAAVRKMIQEALPSAMRLFRKQQRNWHYLGQRSFQTIHGPCSGELMFSWFERGWLSFDVRIAPTPDQVGSLKVTDFRPLKEYLKPTN